MREWDPRRLTTAAETPRSFVAAVVAAFAALTAFVAAHHEPWRDEADAWLVVRDIHFSQFFDWTRHAGTPAFWYGLLAPLARAGLPYESQKWLHLIIATAAMTIFVACAPLSRLTKVLTVFSYYFAYEYSVIVRSYALAILLTFAAAALWHKRSEWPLALGVVLALLCNTNAQGCVIAGAFTIALLAEWALKPAAIAAIGAVAAWWQVRTPLDPAREGARHVFNAAAIPWTLGNAFTPTLPIIAGCAIAAAVLVAITLAIRQSRTGVVVLWSTLAGLLTLYSFVWLGGLRHAGFILVIVLVAIWIGDRVDLRFASAAALLLNGALLLSVCVAAEHWIKDVREPFSGAKEMATFIRGEAMTEIAAHNLTQCEALLPYLPRTRFWYAGLGAYGTYLKWDAAQEWALEMPYPIAEERARREFAARKWLLLFNVEMPDPAAHGFRLLHVTAEPFEKTDERYWLYAPLQ
ncbi:MAG TPA: hypothetical protein VGQ21_21140 [Thermoanaerobaculia bacterium]|jgi:hypothetical protein|nr:hypothetical protein [Thermoanaerobaculia bacterium]